MQRAIKYLCLRLAHTQYLCLGLAHTAHTKYLCSRLAHTARIKCLCSRLAHTAHTKCLCLLIAHTAHSKVFVFKTSAYSAYKMLVGLLREQTSTFFDSSRGSGETYIYILNSSSYEGASPENKTPRALLNCCSNNK